MPTYIIRRYNSWFSVGVDGRPARRRRNIISSFSPKIQRGGRTFEGTPIFIIFFFSCLFSPYPFITRLDHIFIHTSLCIRVRVSNTIFFIYSHVTVSLCMYVEIHIITIRVYKKILAEGGSTFSFSNSFFLRSPFYENVSSIVNES